MDFTAYTLVNDASIQVEEFSDYCILRQNTSQQTFVYREYDLPRFAGKRCILPRDVLLEHIASRKAIQSHQLIGIEKYLISSKICVLFEAYIRNFDEELSRRRNTTQFWSEEELYNTFQACLGALKTLHDNNITHGSIGPQNIIFGQDQQVKLADHFVVSSEYKRNWLFDSTQDEDYGYWAPEIVQNFQNWKNEYETIPADLYALGLVFLEAMTLKSSFEYYYISNGKLHLDIGIIYYNLDLLKAKINDLDYSPELNKLIAALLEPKPENRTWDVVIKVNIQIEYNHNNKLIYPIPEESEEESQVDEKQKLLGLLDNCLQKSKKLIFESEQRKSNRPSCENINKSQNSPSKDVTNIKKLLQVRSRKGSSDCLREIQQNKQVIKKSYLINDNIESETVDIKDLSNWKKIYKSYHGECLNNLPHGKGQLTFYNGLILQGDEVYSLQGQFNMEQSYYHQTSEYQSTRGPFPEEGGQLKSSARDSSQILDSKQNNIYENSEVVSSTIQQVKTLQERLIREKSNILIEEQIKLIGTLLKIKRSELPYNAGSSAQSSPNNGSNNNFIQLIATPQRQAKSLQISISNQTQILQNTIDQLSAENLRLTELLQANEEQWAQNFKQKYLMAFQSLEYLEMQIKAQQISHRKTISDLQQQLSQQNHADNSIQLELLKNQNIDLRRKDNENLTIIDYQKNQITTLNQKISKLENQRDPKLNESQTEWGKKEKHYKTWIESLEGELNTFKQQIKQEPQQKQALDWDKKEKQYQQQLQSLQDEISKVKSQSLSTKATSSDQKQLEEQVLNKASLIKVTNLQSVIAQHEKLAVDWDSKEKQYKLQIYSLQNEVQILKSQVSVSLNDQNKFDEQVLNKTQSIKVQNLQSIIASQDQQIKTLEEQVLHVSLFPSIQNNNDSHQVDTKDQVKDLKIKKLETIINLMDQELRVYQQAKQV